MKKKSILCLLAVLLIAASTHALSLSLEVRPNAPVVVNVHDVGWGFHYVQYSEDLEHWTNFAAIYHVFDTPGTYTFEDITSTNSAVRFYRAVRPF